MNYPIVYDKFETSYQGYGLAVLENAKDVRVTEKLNGEHGLELILPLNDEKWAYIQTDNFIKIDGNLFIVRTTDEMRDNSGRLLSNVQCEHIFYELLDEYHNYKEYISEPAQYILDNLLYDTRFAADALRIDGLADVVLEDATPITGINELLKLFKCEVKCDGLPGPDGKFKVTLYPERGHDYGVHFRYRKNVKSLKKTTDAKGVVTRLYVYGKDGLGIEAVNDGKSYIDSQYITNYPRPKKGYQRFNDIADPDELYQAGLGYLKAAETPNVSYEVDIVELKVHADFGDLEAFELGDWVTVIDEELGYNVKVRIVEYERYYRVIPGQGFVIDPTRSRVVLANFRPGIQDYFSELEETKRIVENVTSGGRVNTYWLDGLIRYYSDKVHNSIEFAQAEIMDEKGILFQNTNPDSTSYGALFMGPGIFAIAKDKNVQGEWDWRTFGTGEGFTADLLNAGKVRADLIQIGGGTVFEEGYDPSTKETSEVVQAKIEAANAYAELKASEAQTAAENVAKAEASLAQTAAESYADGIVTAEEQARISDATAKLLEAKEYAEAQAAAAELAAKQAAALDAQAKADAAASAAQTAAEAYAAAQADAARINAEAYADGIVTAEEQARIDQADANLATAKTYAETKAAEAQAAASAEAQAASATASAAQTAANEAQDTANASKTVLDNMASDTVITQSERIQIRDTLLRVAGAVPPPLLANLTSGEAHSVRQEAVNAGIATNDANYTEVGTKYTALRTYLDGLNPKAWDTASSDNTTIVSADWQTNWKNYYDTVVVLRQAIATKLKDKADAAQTAAEAAQADANNSVQKNVKYDNSITFADGNGMRVDDANGNERVRLGQYAPGKYGVKITDGELYGSLFSTASEGSQDRIEMGGSTPNLIAYKYGVKAFGLYPGYGQPSFEMYGNVDGVAKQTLRFIGGYSDNGNPAGWIGSSTYDGSYSLYLYHGSFTGIKMKDGSYIDFDIDGPGSYNFNGTNDTMYVDGALVVSGYKSGVARTADYGERLLYALEMPESKFMDEGIAELVNGICRVDLDPIFLQTLEPNSEETPFTVHLTAYDWVTIRVKEIGPDYFIVEEKEGLNGKFAWQLTGTRLECGGVRLAQVSRMDDDDMNSNWEDTILQEGETSA
ncbi:phage tail protein [Mycobacteroides abscessus]|uniref:phage tail protein n=1 Tax=Mycobacteroides abscessus TaxID=36809 RepID=UPI000C256EAC|nr:phage tail protein [Mycobacteroides abscessus]